MNGRAIAGPRLPPAPPRHRQHAHTAGRRSPTAVTPPRQHGHVNEQLALIDVGADADSAADELTARRKLDTITRQIGRRGVAIARRALLDARFRRASGTAAAGGAAVVSDGKDLAAAA